MTAALETALEYARRGYYVFPIRPGLKVPYPGFHWTKQSTNDVEKVRKAGEHERYRGCNWACDTERSGLFVVDLDVKDGKKGIETWESTDKGKTDLIIASPTGGIHYYFKGSGRGTVEVIGSGFDTKGEGGYVLIPGSVNGDGKPYAFISNGEPGPIPAWLPARLGEATKKDERRDIPVTDWDKPENIARAVAYLVDEAPEAIEGSGSDTTYKVACRVRDFCISEGTALQLMADHWNDTKAKPKWDIISTVPGEASLSGIVANAYEYSKGQPGSALPEAIFPDPPKSTGAILCAGDLTADQLKPRDWLLHGRYVRKYVTVTFAPGEAGKSSLVLLEGLSIASGKRLTHSKIKDTGAVWYYNTEDPIEEIQLRIAAAAKHHGLTKEDLSNFYYSSGRSNPVSLVEENSDRRGYAINEKGIKWLIEGIQERGAKLLILDPFIRTHRVNENDNNAIDLVVQQLQKIAEATGVAISIVHHAGKGDDDEGNMDKARGASALVSAARIVHAFSSMSKKLCKSYKIDEVRRKWYAHLISAKANLTPPDSVDKWFKKVSVNVVFGSDETISTLETIDLTPVKEVSEHESLIVAVADCMKPGDVKTAHMLAKEVNFPGRGPKTKQRRIEEVFAEEIEHSGLLFRPTMTKETKGRDLVFAVACSECELEED